MTSRARFLAVNTHLQNGAYLSLVAVTMVGELRRAGRPHRDHDVGVRDLAVAMVVFVGPRWYRPTGLE